MFVCCRFDEVKAKVYERLLRKLLHRRSKPAVVLMQLMPKGMAFGQGSRCGARQQQQTPAGMLTACVAHVAA
jgi:hypothetical protein